MKSYYLKLFEERFVWKMIETVSKQINRSATEQPRKTYAFLEMSSNSVQFTSKSFYGGQKSASSLDLRLRRAEKRLWTPYLRPAQSGDLDLRSNPDARFQVFSVQKAAIEAKQDQNDASVCVFAFEIDDKGRRNFLLCAPQQIWKRIQMRKRSCRHFYEVIPQGQKCKLYFDLEYSLTANPSRQIDPQLIPHFVKLVIQKLKEDFDVGFSVSDVIDLDSSTKTKFSNYFS